MHINVVGARQEMAVNAEFNVARNREMHHIAPRADEGTLRQ